MRKTLIVIRHVAAWMVLVSAGSLWAQTNGYSGGIWAPVNAKAVLAAAADITLAKYPDCDEATVDKKMVRVYHADGTAEQQDEEYCKILTEKGKRNNRMLSLNFMLPYSTSEVVQ